MSIIIKGIDMPEKGSFSILYVYGDGSIRLPAYGNVLVKAKYMQASELPPHGRLIDADALKVVMPSIGDEFLYAQEMIEEAPTILEAEEKEE